MLQIISVNVKVYFLSSSENMKRYLQHTKTIDAGVTSYFSRSCSLSDIGTKSNFIIHVDVYFICN